MPQAGKKYLHSLDFLRGLAAVAVCIFHFAVGNADYLEKENWLRIVGAYGHLGVEVFFVISGFVIPYSMFLGEYKLKNFKSFFIKRLIRIEPPYLVSIVLVLALSFFSTFSSYYRGAPFSVDILNLSLHLGYLNAFFDNSWLNPVYWTLAIEFQFYILIALFFPLLQNQDKQLQSFLILILFNLTFFLLPEKSLIFKHAPYFTLGILSYLYFTGKVSKKMFLISTLLITGLIFLQFSYANFIAALLPLPFILWLNINYATTRFLGGISYSLYLLHVPIGARVLNLSENFIHSDGLRTFTVFVALAFSVFAAFVFYKVIEEPAKKLAKSVKYKPKVIPVRNKLNR